MDPELGRPYIKCITPPCSDGIKNYDEALYVCRNISMNLCSVDELDNCCDNSPGGNTCGYDTDWVWVKNQGKLGNILHTLLLILRLEVHVAKGLMLFR